jgi:hypothetical protein
MNLSEISAALEQIGELSGPARQRIEIARTGGNGGEVTIFANREALIYIASLCIDLAERQSEGAHYHFDEVSVDRAEMSVVISFRSE